MLEQQASIVDMPDEQAVSECDRGDRELSTGRRAIAVAVPMLKDDELVGAIVIYRQEVGRSPTSRSSW